MPAVRRAVSLPIVALAHPRFCARSTRSIPCSLSPAFVHRFRFYVPHDARALAGAYGGVPTLCAAVESMFSRAPTYHVGGAKPGMACPDSFVVLSHARTRTRTHVHARARTHALVLGCAVLCTRQRLCGVARACLGRWVAPAPRRTGRRQTSHAHTLSTSDPVTTSTRPVDAHMKAR